MAFEIRSSESTIAPIIIRSSTMRTDEEGNSKLTVDFDVANTAEGMEFVKGVEWHPILSRHYQELAFGDLHPPSFTLECNEWQMKVVVGQAGEPNGIDVITQVVLDNKEKIKWDKRKALSDAIKFLVDELNELDRVDEDESEYDDEL